MADTKHLAFSIIQFLHDQLSSGSLSSDAQESLEVAIQCLETAFGVSVEDQSLAVSQSLPEIFASATKQTPQVKNNSSSGSPSEEQLAEAEHLKTDGNDQMKVENFSAAVEFYSKAIQLNPQNAVYFCNRAAAYSKLGNYAGAVQDCERAIGIDPNYSKAYGRMGLALASLNKYSEAVSFYKKALELDPDNDTYKANLQIAEQKMKEGQPSPVSSQNHPDNSFLLSVENRELKFQVIFSGAELVFFCRSGQQFAQQMQQQNPELIEQLRSQMRSRPPSSAGNDEH
uniref:Small glutamine-rich tetratricopeptide repeat-containing protein alpha n=1 Tax=Sinocyclocheilus grahami TaxID=75366 RepID=A0A672QYC2_SINGR